MAKELDLFYTLALDEEYDLSVSKSYDRELLKGVSTFYYKQGHEVHLVTWNDAQIVRVEDLFPTMFTVENMRWKGDAAR